MRGEAAAPLRGGDSCPSTPTPSHENSVCPFPPVSVPAAFHVCLPFPPALRSQFGEEDQPGRRGSKQGLQHHLGFAPGTAGALWLTVMLAYSLLTFFCLFLSSLALVLPPQLTQIPASKICCCGCSIQIHTDYRNPLEEKGAAWPLSKLERGP